MTTDTESPITPELQGSFSFSRKVSVREYESAEAFINVQFPIPADLSTAEARAEFQANAKQAAFQAKGLVFEELGLAFEVGEDGCIRELLVNTFGNVTEVVANETTNTAAAVPGASAPATASSPPHPVNDQGRTGDKAMDKANSQWAKNRFIEAPQEFYDNRPKKASGEYKETSPDVKHKTTKIAAWLS
jgi:hypothetical protein